MDPMNSAKWLVELEIEIEASIRVLNIFFNLLLFSKFTVFDSQIGVFNNI